jgi:hypothetical protein
MQIQTPYNQISKRWTTPLVIIVAIAVSFLILAPLDLEITNFYIDFIYVAIPAVLAIYSTILAQKLWNIDHPDTKSLTWFAIGSMALFVGEMWWTIDEDILGAEPFPSGADFFYLSSYPFFSAFFWHYLKSHRKFISNKIVLFGFAISAGLLMPSIITTYNLNATEDNFGTIVALAYPTVDVVILGFAVISMMSLFQEGRNYFWIMMTFGIFAWISGNIIFLYAEVNETYYDGHPADIMWLSTYVIRFFAVRDYSKKIRVNPAYVLGQVDSRKIRFGAINQLAIPMSVGSVILISLLILSMLGGFNFSNNTDNSNAIVFLLPFPLHNLVYV